MTSRGTKVLIAVLAAVVIVLYTPSILYGGRLLGIELAKPSINGESIEMEAWWIPISAPGSVLQGVFGNHVTQQVVFVKAGAWKPGFSEKLVVSNAKGIPSDEHLKGAKKIKLGWGELLVLPRNAGESYEHAFSREKNLIMTATDLSAFQDIASFRRK